MADVTDAITGNITPDLPSPEHFHWLFCERFVWLMIFFASGFIGKVLGL
jgi:hypothetical protein